MSQASVAGPGVARGTYEVLVYANGSWRPVSACDDRLTAIEQAKELAENPSFLSVKVTKEQVDELRDLKVRQTIYRSAPLRDERLEPTAERVAEVHEEVSHETGQRTLQGAQEDQPTTAPPKKAEAETGRSGARFGAGLTLRLLLVLGLGLGGLYWILSQL